MDSTDKISIVKRKLLIDAVYKTNFIGSFIMYYKKLAV